MILPVVVRPKAEADIRTIFEENEVIQVGLGERFRDRVHEVFVRIESMLNSMAWSGRMCVRFGSSDSNMWCTTSFSMIGSRF